VGYYRYLKSTYKEVTFNAIQYGYNNSMLEQLKKISDNQQIINKESPSDTIYDLSDIKESYNRFEITNYIGNDFYLSQKEDVEVTSGRVEIDEKTGKITRRRHKIHCLWR